MSIKVLHLIDSGGLYGAEMMLLNLIEEQLKSGLEPVLLSAGEPGTAEKAIEVEARRRGLPVKSFRMKAGINLIKALQIIQYAKREGFNIMHSHGYKFNILIGILPKVIRKIPCVTTLHGYTTESGFSKIKIYQMLERALLNYLDGVVYVSDELKKNALLRGFTARHEAVIFNAIDADRVIAAAADNHSVTIKNFFPDEPSDCIYIGAIGRLSKEKGFDLLIDAFHELTITAPQLRLIIIGEGVLRSPLEQMIASYELQDKILLVGYINPVYRLMKDLDGLIMPSYTEGLPITLLEACILKLPIVASRVGSIEYVLRDYEASIVVSPGDVDALKDAITWLIIDQSNRSKNAGRWSSERFNPKTMAEKYTQFYRRVLCDV